MLRVMRLAALALLTACVHAPQHPPRASAGCVASIAVPQVAGQFADAVASHATTGTIAVDVSACLTDADTVTWLTDPAHRATLARQIEAGIAAVTSIERAASHGDAQCATDAWTDVVTGAAASLAPSLVDALGTGSGRASVTWDASALAVCE